MTKTKLIKLYSNKNFTVMENKERTIFTHQTGLEPTIMLEKKEYVLPENIKHIVLLRDYMMQNSEIQFKSESNQTMVHIDLEDRDINNITIQYKEIKADDNYESRRTDANAGNP